MLEGKHWRDNPDAPFAALLDTVEAYCHPEAYDEAYDDLSARANRGRDSVIQKFKDQLRAALLDPEALPKGALYKAAQYDDGSDMAFLRRLWQDLYPDEPVPGRS
jgi:hypothetical protein